MDSPIIVGATGGSGTRLAAQSLVDSGVYMGPFINDALDSKAFTKPITGALTGKGSDWAQAERLFLAGYQGGPLGFKNPRSMLVLPLLHRRYPGMKFIHLVRDGRDMVLSGNQVQFRLFSGMTDNTANRLTFWAESNETAADYYESRMPETSIRVTYERLTRGRETDRLTEFLGFPFKLAPVAPSSTMGRGASVSIPGDMLKSFRRFGYA